MADNNNEEDDDALFLQACQGNKAAFARLYNKYKTLIFNKIKFKFNKVAERHGVEDAFHDVWIKTLGARQFQNQGTFLAFLVTVCRRHCLDLVAHYNTPINRDPVDIDGETFSEGDENLHPNVSRPWTPEEISDLAQRRERLYQALVQLDPDLSEPFYLHVLVKMKLDEICQALSLTRDQVRYRIEKAKEALSKRLPKEMLR